MTSKAENARILVVDDDASQRTLLAGYLQQCGYEVMTAAGGEEGLAKLASADVKLLISDVRMPGMSGLELMRSARAQHGNSLSVLMVTGYADIRSAVEAMRDGALNYLEKPVDLDELRAVAAEALKQSDHDVGPDISGMTLPCDVIAESPAMRDVLHESSLVAPYDSRVLITGASGTGKEVIANLVHKWSPRRDSEMFRVNCAAIPELLLESELFGYERGAFTGAVDRRIGRFEEAAGGTLFLDEIAEMPASLQAKLLRVTQDGSFQRLGSNQEHKVDVRLLTATNRDLEKEVAEGRFREDLFYRLNVFEIHIPPLRQRTADILPLANLFAARHSDGRHRLSPAVTTSLMLYNWPGNVRELQNAMERAVMMARGGVILPEHLPRRVTEAVADTEADNDPAGKLKDIEDMVILQTLRANQYNRTITARTLGISRRALIYKLRRLEEEGYDVNR